MVKYIFIWKRVQNSLFNIIESTDGIIDKVFSVSKVLLASCYIHFYAGLKFPQFKGQVRFIIVLIIITVHVLSIIARPLMTSVIFL